MIINTGQRTDIPAFYSQWFINRIREGYVMVRNPYCPSMVTKFLLNPDVVDVIGFCTKNPRPMLKYLDELKAFGQFWYVTITGFGRDMEPNVPPVEQVIEDFKYLSNKVGNNAVGFRYTPIIVDDKYTVEYHINTFKRICNELHGFTHLCAFGFLDKYPHLDNNHPEINDTTDENKIIIAKEFKRIALEHDIELRLCSKEKWLSEYDIDVRGCMLIEDYEKAIGAKLDVKKKMQARKGYCSCMLSNDIGAYSSCMHLCRYCYANGNDNMVKGNYYKHDEKSPFLIGNTNPDDKVNVAMQESWKNKVKTLFDF